MRPRSVFGKEIRKRHGPVLDWCCPFLLIRGVSDQAWGTIILVLVWKSNAVHKLNEIFEMFSKKCLLHLFSEFYKSRRSVFELYKSQRSVFEVLIWWFLVYPACDKNLLDRALVYKISVKSLRKISQRKSHWAWGWRKAQSERSEAKLNFGSRDRWVWKVQTCVWVWKTFLKRWWLKKRLWKVDDWYFSNEENLEALRFRKPNIRIFGFRNPDRLRGLYLFPH